VREPSRRAGSGSADDGTRRDTGSNATPTWPVIAAPIITAAADVDVPIHIHVTGVDVPAVYVGGVEIPAVYVGAVEVSAVNISCISSDLT